MRIKLLIIFFLGWSIIVEAQKLGYSYEPNIHIGSIFRHTPSFTAPINGMSIGVEVNTLFHTTGKKVWHEYMGYPTFGLAVSYFNFGDRQVFGSGYGFIPNVNFRFLKSKIVHGQLCLGTGLAVLDTPFDIVENPLNDATSAYLNNITRVRIGLGWTINKNFELQTSGSFTHYSNGASSLPNLGINVAAFNLGLRYSPQPLEEKDYKHYDDFPEVDKRIRVNLYYGMAFRATGTSGGPQFPIYLVSAHASRMLTRANRFSAGMEYEFAGHLYAFMNHIGLFETQKQRRQNASRVILSISDEVIWGRTAFFMQIGGYLTSSYGQQFPIFEKLGVRYYIPIAKSSTKIHLGIYLKAHKIVAESVTYGLGVYF